MALRSFANIKTKHASKYMQQLCKHWSHKIENISFDTEKAHIPFRENIKLDIVAKNDELLVELSTPLEEDAIRMEDVFDRHIVRFAFREELQIQWKRENIS